jgi:acyl dehydratase
LKASRKAIPLPPRRDRRLEDYAPGAVYEFGEIELSEDELLEFARKYDPQPALHTDKELAEAGPFGGLVASGWHTLALMMRLYVDHYLPETAGWVSPGVDKVRWLKPVRPGDRLHIRITILNSRRRRSDPRQGAISALLEGFNHENERVASLEVVTFMFARSPAPAQASDHD